MKVETTGQNHVFEVQVFLDDLDPNLLRLELYADGGKDSPPLRREMKQIRQLVGSVNGYLYGASVSANRPAADYTARIVPHHPRANVPFEANQILWQR